MLESRNESTSSKLKMERSFQSEDSPVDRRHPAMCVAVALNPFHTCPALPPSHRIPPVPVAARRTPGKEVDKKCCHSSRPNPSQRCSGGGATGFRAEMHRRSGEEGRGGGERTRGRLQRRSGPRIAVRKNCSEGEGEEYVHQGARRRVAGRVRAHR